MKYVSLCLASLAVVALVGCGGGGGKKSSGVTQWTSTTAQRTGATRTDLVWVNTGGTAVGTSDNRLVTYTEAGGFTVFGTLGGATSKGFMVNDSGVAVGQADNGTVTRAVQTSGTALVEFSLALSPTQNSSATVINNEGTVAGVIWDGSGYDVWRISGSTVQTLTDLGGTGVTTVNGINATGQLTGSASKADGTFQAYRTQGNSLVQIGGNPGAFAQGYAINATGTVVGSFTLNGFQVPFKAEGATITALPMPLGATDGIAFGINDGGDIVGCVTISGKNFAYLWRGTSGFDLNSSLKAALPAGASLTVAKSIRNNGTIVSQLNINGQDHSAILKP